VSHTYTADPAVPTSGLYILFTLFLFMYGVFQVVGDDTTALDVVLECDSERLDLLAEEAELMAALGDSAGGGDAPAGGAADGDGGRQQQGAAPQQQQQQQQQQNGGPSESAVLAQRLQAVVKRLHEIGGSDAALSSCPACCSSLACCSMVVHLRWVPAVAWQPQL
jgi:hypothetical protein